MQDIPGYEGIYRISTDGVVHRIDRENTLKSHVAHTTGYRVLTLTKYGIQTKHYIHRLLATTYLPNPESLHQVNHIDGNKLNNNLDNLEWCTPKHNSQHARDMGLTLRDGNHPCAKLTIEKVREIKLLLLNGNTLRSIADKFNVNFVTIYDIKAGKTWKRVQEESK